MERLLARLERRLGRFAVEHLILYVVAGMAIVWVLSLSRPYAVGRLMLDIDAVRRGQVWRLFTFLFLPPPSSTYWILLNLYFAWWVGSSLEQHWGAFKFNVFYFVGVAATILGAVVGGPTTNFWLNFSLLLSFATLFPDVTIMLMFVLPVRVKWLGIASADRAAIVASVVNYVLFFGEHWWGVWRGRRVVVRQQARREELRSTPPVFGQRVCAMCGASEADGADIRVCSCAKCGGQARALCLQHARNH
jgi:membrane associated rhomboid family serine protease